MRPVHVAHQDHSEKALRAMRGYAVSAAVVTLLISTCVALGWILEVPSLKRVLPTLPPIKLNAALALICASVGLWLAMRPQRSFHRVTQVLGCVTLVIAGLSFSEHLFGWDLGIDQLWVKDVEPQFNGYSPGRMSFPTSIGLTFVGLALITLEMKTRVAGWPAQYLALFVWLMCLTGVVAYVFGLRQYEGIFRSAMSVNIAATLAVLATGILAARPTRGFVSIVTSKTAGGQLARWLMVPALILPVLIGWLAAMAARAGAFPLPLTAAVAAVMHILVFSVMVWVSALALHHADLLQQRAESERIRVKAQQQVEQKQHETLRFLAGAGDALSRSLDLQETLGTLVRLLVEKVADGCVAELSTGKGGVGCVAVGRAHPLDVRVHCMGLENHDREDPASEAIREMHPVEQRTLPISAQGVVHGSMTLVRTSLRSGFSEAELAMAEELGNLGAAALERARLFQEVKEAVRTREEVLAVVSHDLRNPLGALKLSTQMLGRSLPEDARTHALGKRMDRMMDAIGRMEHLVDDLLDFGRLGAGKFKVHPEPQNVQQLLDEALASQEPLAAAKGQTLRTDFPPDAAEVLADRNRFFQILSNLIGNAIKFGPPGGQIRVSFTTELDHDEIHFTVADEGPGIPSATLQRLFEPFVQAEGQGEEARRSGAGLGLYITRGIVESHGGRIWAEPGSEGGAVFHFTLPQSTRAQNAAPAGLHS